MAVVDEQVILKLLGRIPEQSRTMLIAADDRTTALELSRITSQTMMPCLDAFRFSGKYD